MIEPKKIIPGHGVSINTKVSEQTHKKMTHLRAALAYKQGTNYRMTEIFQLVLETGIKNLESQIDLEPAA